MPIRINLLAEAQAAEELRRKDPVKRAILGAALLVFAVLVWSSTLQFKVIGSKSELGALEAKWKAIEKDYQVAVESRRKALEAHDKLAALQQLTTNRFLWGTTLNAFQQTLANIDDVQVVRLKGEQTYTLKEEVKPPPNAHQATVKPATATEKIVLTIEAIDTSPQPGSQAHRYKEAIATQPYFQSQLERNAVLLTTLSPPQASGPGGSPFAKFTLECSFPEKVR